MEANILNAIINVIENPANELREFYQSKNRANNMGETLEEYIKDVFANTIAEQDESKRLEKLEKNFSYLGNQNNPPDIIIRGGDAIEVKKIQSKNAGLALNSSYPKAKLFSSSTMITDKCRTCEDWTEKDIIYAVGVVNEKKLLSLCFVYGVDYAASSNIYERIKDVISSGINNISDVEFADTKELGRVNRVDPLGITYLRIRGMWHIQNPMKTFEYLKLCTSRHDYEFEFMAIINLEKYNSFSDELRMKFEKMAYGVGNLNIDDVKIKIPDNPAHLRSAKLITFFR
jgi:hypothetical protein